MNHHHVLTHHIAKDGFGLPFGSHSPGLQHQQSIGESCGFIHVVCRQNHRHALSAQRAHQFPHRHAGLRVQARGRLIQKNHLGLMHDGPCDHQSALVAAGKRFGLLVCELAQAKLIQQLLNAFLQPSWPRAVIPPRLFQISLHCEIRIKRVILCAHAQLPPRLIGLMLQIMPGDANGPRVGTQISVAHPQ